MRVQLILSDIEEYLGHDPAILLGACCADEQVHHFCIEPVINEAEQISLASEQCRSLYENVLPILAARINHELGINISIYGYRLILGNWLRNFIEAIHHRYLNAEEAIRLFPGLYVTTSTPAKAILVDDYPDFQRQLQTPIYNRFLLLQIFQKIAPARVTNALPPTSHSVRVVKNTWAVRDRLFHWLHRLRPKFSRSYILISNATLPYFTKIGILRFLIRGAGIFSIDNLKFSLDCTFPIRTTFRNTSLVPSDQTASDDIKRLIYALVPANIPLFFLEALPTMIEQAGQFNTEKIAAVYTNFGIHNNSLLKTVLAINESTLPLLCHQHGGRYCLDEIHFPFEYEREVATEILLWGGDERGTYVPSLKLKPRRAVRNARTGLLLGLTNYNRYHQRYILKPQCGPYKLSQYHHDTQRFISLIDSSIPITIRSPTCVRDCFSELEREVHYDQADQSFESELPNYTFYCVDHLGTTMLESISMGIPTIAVLDKRFVRYHHQAREIMASLENVGIIHYSPESAATFVNDRFVAVDQWWDSEPVQTPLERFREQFAQSSQDPEHHLSAYFRTLIRSNENMGEQP